MKIYSVCTRYWNFGAVTEYEVDKETEKTYVVHEAGHKYARSWSSTVRKSEMARQSEHFYLSLDEVKEGKKRLYESRIASNKATIAQYEKENETLAERLKALEEGDINA